MSEHQAPTDVAEVTASSVDTWDPVPAAVPDVALPAAVPPAPTSFVYAIGRIEPRFPSLGVEKEFAQAVGRSSRAGLTDRQSMRSAFTERSNRYLARSLCWVLLVETLETYILLPRDPADLDLLIESYREDPRRDDLDVVIGVRGPIAAPDMCNGLALPVVVFDQIYSFDRDALVASIPVPPELPKASVARFRTNAGTMLDHLVQLADNAGALDEHRAVNYLMLRYPQLYATATTSDDRNFTFTGIEVRRSALSGAREIVDVILSFRHRESNLVEKHSVRVDVEEEYPFLVAPMRPFFDR